MNTTYYVDHYKKNICVIDKIVVNQHLQAFEIYIYFLVKTNNIFYIKSTFYPEIETKIFFISTQSLPTKYFIICCKKAYTEHSLK